ncbi:unnamed protein product [Lepeophtheirus salmonis]|uniref:(salmon louse) hypothetical protein n=1 Tax=Lepeophtheirus salmonis TaxID=72036 RepID=A0A7R8CNT6_LEPSM|nr:unnamed protein product [Lepeophtheirus salmonis]CAF2878522.1 unnamed protein product [Lepeophtheirus salmonis]
MRKDCVEGESQRRGIKKLLHRSMELFKRLKKIKAFIRNTHFYYGIIGGKNDTHEFLQEECSHNKNPIQKESTAEEPSSCNKIPEDLKRSLTFYPLTQQWKSSLEVSTYTILNKDATSCSELNRCFLETPPPTPLLNCNSPAFSSEAISLTEKKRPENNSLSYNCSVCTLNLGIIQGVQKK